MSQNDDNYWAFQARRMKSLQDSDREAALAAMSIEEAEAIRATMARMSRVAAQVRNDNASDTATE